ncbi:MAG: hypothetical protein IKD90_11765 [Clostridiales bacterium]|nr:hypothetical protein [Clostridiales bacterium]
MDGLALFFAIVGGISIGTGLAFLLMAGILNYSNNIGDSRAQDDSISTQIMFTSQESKSPFDALKMPEYVDAQLSLIVQSEDYRKYRVGALNTDASAVTRLTNEKRQGNM